MDTNTGRFISQDTYQGSTADPDSLHKYLYVNSNPVMYSDPNGNVALLLAGGVALVVSCVIEHSYDSAVLAIGLKIIADLLTAIDLMLMQQLITILLLKHINDIASGATTSAEANEEAVVLHLILMTMAIRNRKGIKKLLIKIINELYRQGAITGDGGTADKLRDEIISGGALSHLQKHKRELYN